MTGTKERLLELLEKNRGQYISGEEAAKQLDISRTAVWKAVNSLRKEGYEICAVPNKGYSLSSGTDILSVQGIRRYLRPAAAGLQLEVLQEVDSTNNRLREQAAAGALEGTVIVAGRQTAGKGRPVSYTHLDVYKRQGWDEAESSGVGAPGNAGSAAGLPGTVTFTAAWFLRICRQEKPAGRGQTVIRPRIFQCRLRRRRDRPEPESCCRKQRNRNLHRFPLARQTAESDSGRSRPDWTGPD